MQWRQTRFFAGIEAVLSIIRELFVQKIRPSQLKQADQARSFYVASPAAGTTRADMLKPSYWAPLALILNAGDRIDALAPSGLWYLSLVVLSRNDYGLRIGEIRYCEFTAPVADDVHCDISFAGPLEKWRVVRNGLIYNQGFPTKEAAQKWFSEATYLHRPIASTIGGEEEAARIKSDAAAPVPAAHQAQVRGAGQPIASTSGEVAAT